MADKVIKIDHGGFTAALTTMLSQSKRSSVVVVREQAKGVIRKVIAVTPPGKSSTGSLGEGKKAGQAKTAKDILKIFVGVGVKNAELTDMSQVKSVHRAARKGGQVRNGPSRKITVPKTMLNEYLRAQKKKVGRLAAGWSSAAREFGISLPSWISQHSTPSSVQVITSGSRFGMKATNKSPHAGSMKRLEGQIKHAVYSQAAAMRKRIASMRGEVARRAGLKASK